MGIRQTYFYSRSMRTDLPFVVLTLLTWFAVSSLASEGMSTNRLDLLLFAVVAAGATYFVLAAIGYFNIFRLLPRKSDVFLLMAAIPVGGICARLVFLSSGAEAVFPLDFLLLVSPLVAFLVFGTHYLYLLNTLSDSPRKIVLETSSEEAARLVRVFNGLKRTSFVEFLSANDLREFLLSGRQQEIELIVISKSVVRQFEEDALLMRAHLAGIPIVDYHKMLSDLSGRIFLDQESLWGYLVAAKPQTPLLRSFWSIKEVLEPVLAIVLGLLLSPVMLLVALAIRLESRGPVFYKQVRTGYHGKNFTLVKFRSMYLDAEKSGPQWAANSDKRVTRVGRFLRKVRLDELPQLWNVFKCEMSFCGPRPERPEIYGSLMEEIPLFRLRTIVRPGITGWAQICSGYASSVDESRQKLEYDLYYIQNMSPRLDLIILIKTILVAVGLSDPEKGSSKDTLQMNAKFKVHGT